MGEIIQLFSTKLKFMCDEYKKKIHLIPSWQLDNILPNEVKQKPLEDKVDFLLEKYKNESPVYNLLNNDLTFIKINKNNIKFQDLKSVNIDPRYLESIGLKENQISDYYEFITSIKKLL